MKTAKFSSTVNVPQELSLTPGGSATCDHSRWERGNCRPVVSHDRDRFSSGVQCAKQSSGKFYKENAFTMVEALLATGIFSLLVLGIVSAQLYGMRVYTLAATKLVATAGARQVMNDLRDQIRQANTVYVGNCSSDWTTYADVTNGAEQGNAVQIYPTTNSTPYLICYLDSTTSTNRLMLYNSSSGTVQELASYITNLVVFDAEDLYGNVLTANQNNRVIRMTLQFSQWEYPIAHIGGTNYNSYDYYQLRTRATRRSVD